MTSWINDFRGSHYFLSNFATVDGGLIYEGLVYPTVEHAFQAAKPTEVEFRRYVLTAGSPMEAKCRGRNVQLRAGWTAGVRFFVMEDLIAAKFAPFSPTAEALLGTGDALLVEGNSWHDNLWGDCTCRAQPRCGESGAKVLGWMLMRQRDRLRAIR